MTNPHSGRISFRPGVAVTRILVVAMLVAALVLAQIAPVLANVPAPVNAPAVAQEGLSGPVIVVLESGAEPVRTLRESGVSTNPGRSYTRAIRGFAATLTAAEVTRLARNPRVRSITPDLPVQAQEQTLPTGADRVEADRNGVAAIGGNGGAVNASIAILDSGIDASHPDLTVAGGVDCIGSGGYGDVNGHGTHVAGIAAARDNDFGTVGIAPGASLYAVRVLRADLSGSFSTLICGLDWVIANAGSVDVVNMSLAGTGSDGACTADPLHQALCNVVAAGVTVVVAAGNFSRDVSNTVPATYAEVITVSAFNDYNGTAGGGAGGNCSTSDARGDDQFAGYSNFGADVDIVAPGTCIRSTAIGGGTSFRTGTSMASPHVAGAAALVIATNPSASPASVRSAVLGQSVAQGAPAGIGGDPDGVREPVLQVATAAPTTPTATATAPVPSTSAPTATPSGRTLRGGTATSTPRPAVTPPPTATSAPGVTPPPTSVASTATPSSRTVRGGVATATPQPGVTPVPTSALPTATPASRTIRGSTSGADVSGSSSTGRSVRSATATVELPAPTSVPPTMTEVPPTSPPVPTETPILVEATATPVPTPSAYPPVAVTDEAGDGTAWFVTDDDLSTAWYADTSTPTPAVTPESTSESPDEGPSLLLDFGAEVPVGQVRWVFGETGYADQYDIQISSDGISWQTVATRENAPAGEWQSLDVGLSARYVRFLFANPFGDPVVGGLVEIEVVAPAA